jgi:transcriptional regulator with PAS, ATPase and Fis domain
MNPTRGQAVLDSVLSVMESVVCFMDEGVIVAREDGQVLFHNPAAYQLLGLPGNEPIASTKQLGSLNLQKSVLRAAIDAGEVDAAGRPSGRFVRFVHPVVVERETRYVEFHTGAVELSEGERLRLVLMRDRTEGERLDVALGRVGSEGLVTRDAGMREIIAQVHQIAPTQASVVIQGESGTGKTQLARMIHRLSGRAAGPFVEVNCAAIPETLIESELFGHVRGAFTGAAGSRVGRFMAADRGTLFLDEVSELPVAVQPKLLRAIQDQAFEKLGSDKPLRVDTRMIAASNRGLRKLVDTGGFRADLYYRLAVIPIKVPALRERRGDIPLLVEHFLEQLRERGYPQAVSVAPEALRVLMDYPWPGNVRELANAVEHGIICAQAGVIRIESLPQDLRAFVRETQGTQEAVDAAEEDRERIRAALARADGNRSAAAALLGIDRTTLWRRMQRYGLS